MGRDIKKQENKKNEKQTFLKVPEQFKD